jgi:predicted TPR repeat methyltransferase
MHVATTHNINVPDIDQQIANMRSLISNNPKNARAMAKLSCLLTSKSKLVNKEKEVCVDIATCTSHQESAKLEAMIWAERSIKSAPSKPFGYVAMSMIQSDFGERMQALRMAIKQCSMKDQYDVAAIDLLVRALVEQRNELTRNQQCIAKSSFAVGKTYQVSSDEKEDIRQLEILFNKVWKDSSIAHDSNCGEFLGIREYRFGRFLRKLEPSDIYRAKSQFYLEIAIDHLPYDHPQLDMAKFWLETVSRRDATTTLTRCPAEYVIGLYSTFASRFDSLLVGKLEYQTPTKLRLLHDQTVLEPWNGCVERRYRAIADLGCGTGLSGLAFCSLLSNVDSEFGQMTGVDLSPEMLSYAAKTRCYNKLVNGDITNILTVPASFDLVIACDVFCYIGDLSDVFGMVYTSLIDGGIFVFSTEKIIDVSIGAYCLHECARFAHNQSYILNLAKDTCFQVVTTQTSPIRKNKGKDVIGLLVILRKIST